MSKADKNDLIYFKEACDKTYATSRNVDSEGLVQQTINGQNIYPKTISEAIIMSDGKSLEEAIEASNAIVRANNMTISGVTNITSTGTYQYGLAFSPNNYNVDIESIEVTSDCPEITISNITEAGFAMNVSSIPSATDHKLTIAVKDKLGALFTKEVSFTVKVEPTALSISGSTEIDNETSSNYTIAYTPSAYNVVPTSVEITSNQSSVAISNKSKTGFTLTPNCTEGLTATITVKATLPSGKTITNTKNIVVNCGPDYDAIDEYEVAYMDVKGKFYPDASSWMAAGAPTINGIAVSDGTHRFCIAQDMTISVCANVTNYPDSEYWGAYSKTVSGVTTTINSTTAKSDYNGVANTDAIVANVNSSDGYFTKAPWSAAGLCRQYTFPNGAKGYLGACGEWSLVQNKISKINELLDEISGVLIDTESWPYYWASTQYSSDYAWYWLFFIEDCNYYGKYNYRRVRAFCTI